MKRPRALRWAILVVTLYGFLLSIGILGQGLKMLGGGFARDLIALTSNPLVGIFIGILATAVIQSSSCTTSIVVGFVASGTLTIPNAIPIVMGANIGTTVTNTLVSFGHITRSQEFSRAFPAAIVHDLFNILSVLVLFPLEVHFHLLQKLSFGFVQAFQGLGGMTITSPFKFLVEPAASGIAELLGWPILVLTIALLGLFTALKFLVSSIRALVSRKLEVFLDRYLFGAAWKSFLLGLLLTSIIQSSSVITSIIVPLVGAGLLTIEKVFPYTLGANLGTTVTALLASFATGEVVAVQAAFAHLGFNLLGCAIWYPLRRAPIGLAKALGGIVARHRVMGIVWIGVVFFLIPIIIILLF